MMKKWRRHRVAVCFMSRRNAVAAPFGSIAKKVLFRYFFYVDIIDFCALWVYTEKNIILDTQITKNEYPESKFFFYRPKVNLPE